MLVRNFIYTGKFMNENLLIVHNTHNIDVHIYTHLLTAGIWYEQGKTNDFTPLLEGYNKFA